MIKLTLIFSLIISFVNMQPSYAEDGLEKQLTTINLKHITGKDVVSVLSSLIDSSIIISEKDDVLSIEGTADKTKNILAIIEQIDTPPTLLTLQFIASNKKVDLTDSKNTYRSSNRTSNTSQTLSITERQWVKLNTGISIPMTERKRHADGTESQSFKFKKISKSYLFKVHEFSGWSVVQVGLNESYLSEDIAGAIEHTQLNTTIVGKTEEWIEVASSRPINEDSSATTYSTNRDNKQQIYLYVKILAPKNILQDINNKTK